MAVKLYRCSGRWVRIKGHPCWRVEKALQDMGIEYESVNLPASPRKREQILALTGQKRYPAIELDDGTIYREESKKMEQRIREGRLETAPPTSR